MMAVASPGAAACKVPYKHPDRNTAIRLRPHLRVGNTIEEDVGPCVEVNGVRYFGLTFYEGEGSDGIGGIGRYDPSTKKLEVRRPQWLRDKSVGPLTTDGHTMWFGAYQQYEKNDVWWGLVRYDWDRNVLTPLVGSDAPCGAHITDLHLDATTLRVTTTAGRSSLDLATGRWSVPSDCHRFYRAVIEGALKDYELDPIEQIARIDPAAARAIIFKRKLDPKHFGELQMIGMVSRNFTELKKYAIDRVADPQWLAYALDRFAKHKSKERAWRDFALAFARRTGHVDHLRYFRGDAEIFDYLVAHRSVELLPWIDSKRAIPVLLDMLAKAPDADALLAIERAAHLRIEADGTRTPLAPDSDTPEYADEEFGAFERSDRAEIAAIAGRWREWAKARK